MKKLLLLLILLFIFISVFPQSKYGENYRPKIAVVLSGGGAKGLAHVGFLQVMEQAGIHPDLVVGTSMGSIVGGLYSIGFTPDSIKKMISVQDWGLVLSNKVGLRQINIEEKLEYGEYIAEFPLKGIVPQMPSGAIKGHELELLFDKLTWTASKDTSFDEFPIPFRCVAVDMLTGDPHVFKSGSLTLAMRASMSIPTIMEPIKYKDMLLVDGGLVNNFPVDVAKDWGADIIIGVYVGGQLQTEEQLNSMIALLMQSSLLASIKDAERKRKLLNVYIEPPLNDLSSADFDKSKIFIKRGYDESMKYFDTLHSIAVYMEKFPPKEIEKQDLIDSVQISQFETTPISNKNTRKMVYNMIGNNFGGYVKADDIHKEISYLYGTRLFDKIGYNLFLVDSTHFRIKYYIKESSVKSFNFALNYSTDNKVSLIFQLVFRNLLLSGSKIELKFRASELPAFEMRYLKYLGTNNKNSIAIGYTSDYSIFSIYNNSTEKISQQYRRVFRNLFFEYNHYVSLQSEVKVYFAQQYFDYNSLLDVPMGEFVRYKMGTTAMGMRYYYNNLDRKYFPNSGSSFNLSGVIYLKPVTTTYYAINDTIHPDQLPEFVMSDSNNVQMRMAYANYHKYGKFTIINSADAFVTYSKSYSLNSFLTGGANEYSHFHNISFYGLPYNYNFANTGFIYRFGIRFELLNKLYLSGVGNIMFETPSVLKLPRDLFMVSSYMIGAGVGISYDSPIGPISIILSKNANFGPFWTYFNIGYNF